MTKLKKMPYQKMKNCTEMKLWTNIEMKMWISNEKLLNMTVAEYERFNPPSVKYTPQTHKGIGAIYISDEHFQLYYDKEVPGCANFLHLAICKCV